MSNLNVQNLNGVNVQNLPSQMARAWVNFDGSATPITIRKAFNVASITDNGTGNYTANFIIPFFSPDYATIASAGSLIGDNPGAILTISSKTVSSIGMRWRQDSPTGVVDWADVSLVVFW